MEITEDKGIRIGVYEPGNGTRYTAVAVPWSFDGPMGQMGCVPHGWLVVSGNNARAFLFQASGHLTDKYVEEKLGGCSHGGEHYFGDLIRALVGRDHGQKED